MQPFVVGVLVAGLCTLASGEAATAPASCPSSRPCLRPSTAPTSRPSMAPTSRRSTAPTSHSTSHPLEPSSAAAPLPDQSSGVVVEEGAGAGALLWIPRVVFYLPRRAIGLVFTPLQQLAYAWDRFQLPQRFKDVFFNDSGNFGVYPVAFIDTGIGLNAGVRLVSRDLFDRGEGLRLRASYGGRYRQFYSGSIHSGRRWKHLRLQLTGGYESGEKLPFFGIGNGDEVSQATLLPGEKIDPLVDDVAVKATVRKDIAFAKLAVAAWPNSIFRASLSCELRHQAFEADAEQRIDKVFVVDRLVGVGATTFDIYPQLRLTIDTRRSANAYMSQAITSRGFYINGWLGYARGFSGDPSNHLRYAADAHGFLDLYGGDRVLSLHLYLDGVTAELDEIPFTDLPSLGGAQLLRGYADSRFRGRALTLASIEYQYNLSARATAFLFVDTGRVWRDLADFVFEDFRVGFGGGLLLHTKRSFTARLQLAGSIDGGFFVSFGFDAGYDPKRSEEGSR